MKDSIQHIAINNLVWYCDWDQGTIDYQIDINEYGNSKEFYIVGRQYSIEPFDWASGATPPHCAFTPELDEREPEVGQVEFVVSDKDADFFAGNARKDVEEAFEAIKKQQALSVRCPRSRLSMTKGMVS